MPLGYATFARFYDRSIEQLYAPYRRRIAEAAEVRPSGRVLDLACGTGQGLAALVAQVPHGEVVGVDMSAAMLDKARQRVAREGWSNVTLREMDARQLDDTFDAVVVALGLSVIGPWQEVFAHTWSLLKPGGRYVIFDVYAQRWVLQTAWVEFLAGADLHRRVWEPLHAVCEDPRLEWLEGWDWVHGGKVLLATGTKPRAASGG